jgi:hypothetical protein
VTKRIICFGKFDLDLLELVSKVSAWKLASTLSKYPISARQ